jgi:hypothetical protein
MSDEKITQGKNVEKSFDDLLVTLDEMKKELQRNSKELDSKEAEFDATIQISLLVAQFSKNRNSGEL